MASFGGFLARFPRGFGRCGLNDSEFHRHENFMSGNQFDMAAAIELKAAWVLTAQAKSQQRSRVGHFDRADDSFRQFAALAAVPKPYRKIIGRYHRLMQYCVFAVSHCLVPMLTGWGQKRAFHGSTIWFGIDTSGQCPE